MAPPDATATQARWRRARAGVWDDPRRFSWLRCLIVVATYTLLCSDVLRSGVGLRSLDQFPTLQPNLYLAFGPWGYPVNTVWANSTDDDTAAEWAYKFDSTSIAWRACTQHWNLTSWPSCLLYNGTCPSPTIPAVTLLRMMDDLITHAASADGSLLSRARDAPSMFVLRARYKIQDRVHDHVFPQWFLWSGMTTVQATYYAPNQIAASKASRPFDPCAWVDSQPQYCFGPWPSFPHDISGALMPASSYISTDIARRLQTWQEQFPTSIIDLLILSQSSDPDASRDSASYTSTTIFDVSTIIRVRTCDSGGCRTLVMDDHRYEGGEYSTDVIEWLPVASSLRWSAQVYFLVRLVGAYVGCFIARRQEDTYVDANVLKVGVAALRTMMQLPCQSVVWGSPIPVVFYALAHTIDAPMVYRVLYEKFSTMEGGEVAFNMWQAGWLCAIQMRNIWLLGLAAQVIVWFQTSKSWSSGRGVAQFPLFTGLRR
ncbi:TPA: hypothetical protein N0F65_003701 [Lagenidium giganteum]|uniref:Membrane-associated protein n=1 Tax=Lagenidium giganteum TaxID=4803 RepID=A0AAV2YRP6_9STRA|nr:TPA: hypothetical protein N0F65_003701 [Lagenidium giganteum]